jgi:hypothetical protein
VGLEWRGGCEGKKAKAAVGFWGFMGGEKF